MTLLNPGDQFPTLTVSLPDGNSLALPGAVAEVTGAFVNDEPKFLESTGFVLDPDGRVVVSVCTSRAIGRLVPDDVVGLIRYLRDHASASA